MRARSHQLTIRALRRSFSAELYVVLGPNNLTQRLILMAALVVFASLNFPALPSVEAYQLLGTQQRAASIRGHIADQLGGSIVGAVVSITNSKGIAKTTQTDANGNFVFQNVVPGRYTLRATARGFAPFEQATVDVAANGTELLNLTLDIAPRKERVTVTERLQTDLSAIILTGDAIRALSIGPGGLIAALQALAAPSAGPDGAQIVVDGFADGPLPPTESIREIRINRNAFSAEYDKPKGGRVEIFTKPGADHFAGSAYFSFNDESLNSRNPYATYRAPSQSRLYGVNFSGPIVKKRASFFVDFERQATDNNAVVNATVLDSSFNIRPYNQVLLTPQYNTSFSPRIDYQLDSNNTLVARYTYTTASSKNGGVGDFSLPSRAYVSSMNQHSLRVTETNVLSQRVINESRFQYLRERSVDHGNNSIPTTLVPESFIGDGSDIGLSLNNKERWEWQNHTTWSLGQHVVKAGEQLHIVRVVDSRSQNFGGTFTFAGGLGPQLDAANQIVRDESGHPIMIPISNIERYRRTMIFQQLGLTRAEIRALGGGPTQFSIAGGTPLAHVGQYDLGVFLQDDWRLRPDFAISLGMRFETQNNLDNQLNLAPRIGFAWAPGMGVKQSSTVIRGGFGLFYDRFSENLTLRARRSNGVTQKQFVVSDPEVLDSFDNVPSVEALSAFAIPQSIIHVARNLTAPYTMRALISVERQLPLGLTLTGAFKTARTLHLLRSRNINAPLSGAFAVDGSETGERPFGNTGEIFQYESSGISNQKELSLTIVRSGKRATFYSTYVWNKAQSDTDGADSFPANTYDLRSEYGRSATDSRHSFYAGGWIRSLWGIDLSPLIFMRSGLPFNITTGRDTNGDMLFLERPAFATDLTRPTVVLSRFGAFDLEPGIGGRIIPRNFGIGPGFFSVNMNFSKTISLGSDSNDADSPAKSSNGNGHRGIANVLRRRSYGLTIAVQVENVFNHTNAGTPVGNLSSPLFGQSYSSAGAYGFGANPAGNRRIRAQLTLTF